MNKAAEIEGFDSFSMILVGQELGPGKFLRSILHLVLMPYLVIQDNPRSHQVGAKLVDINATGFV